MMDRQVGLGWTPACSFAKCSATYPASRSLACATLGLALAWLTGCGAAPQAEPSYANAEYARAAAERARETRTEGTGFQDEKLSAGQFGPRAKHSVESLASAPGVVADGDGAPPSPDDDVRLASNADAPPPAPQRPSPVQAPPSPPAGGAPNNPVATPPKEPAAHDKAPHEKAMLVYTARLNMAVYLVEPGLDAVERVARDMGGYLATRGDRKIEVRVPREKFQAALTAIEQTGEVLHRDIRAEDVTDRFVDMESRLRNARAMRQRLQQLLERAPVKEAIEIERELGRVTAEIEVLEGKLKLLRDQIAFSTITVEYAPKASAIQKASYALPFPWLGRLGLPNLLRVRDNKGGE